jgi:hypothetical protein
MKMVHDHDCIVTIVADRGPMSIDICKMIGSDLQDRAMT